ncbi:putative methyltransferase-domain-containing protein [Podospora conica]|nr:putative methyltransferase-domain-containing protein [Schizothecium conicum]
MHYIRLLRPPTVERTRTRHVLKIALTITTDLGDAYLSPQEPIEIAVIGAYRDESGALKPVILTQNATPRWRAEMRVLKFDLQLPPSPQPIQTIQVRPASRRLAALGTSDVFPVLDGPGLIMGVYADMPSDQAAPSRVCFRSLRLVGSDVSGPVNALQVEEDFGDSIARHIWDGGVVTLSMIASLCLTDLSATPEVSMPLLRGILRQPARPLNILELGCGVGIVGIGLSRILRACSPGEASHILMTDLQEAEERTLANISRYSKEAENAAPDVDFESLDWHEGKNGGFGAKVEARAWDLIVVSECTYNTDTLLALVQTLSALHMHSADKSGGSCNTKIFLATKPRHSLEREAFDMLAKDGWVVDEKTVVPLPVLNSAGQSVEMYLFSRTATKP